MDYGPIAERSLAAIEKKGADVVFTGGEGSVYDPLTDTWSGGSTALVTGSAIQKKPSADDLARFASRNLVLVNPVTLIVAASGLAVRPESGMTMTWAGQTYAIEDVDPIAPDGTPLLYTVTGSR